MRHLTFVDLAVYAWTSVFLLALLPLFPPLALLWLALPWWHRRRAAKRHARRSTTYTRFIERGRP